MGKFIYDIPFVLVEHSLGIVDIITVSHILLRTPSQGGGVRLVLRKGGGGGGGGRNFSALPHSPVYILYIFGSGSYV